MYFINCVSGQNALAIKVGFRCHLMAYSTVDANLG